MDVWMYGCMDLWMYVCIDGWMDGCMDVLMYMDVWMYVCIYNIHKDVKKNNMCLIFPWVLNTFSPVFRSATGTSIQCTGTLDISTNDTGSCGTKIQRMCLFCQKNFKSGHPSTYLPVEVSGQVPIIPASFTSSFQLFRWAGQVDSMKFQLLDHARKRD